MKRFAALSACLPVILLCFAASASVRLVATIPVGTAPESATVNESTNLIYVTNLNSNSVSVIDGSTNSVVATVTVGSSPRGIDVNSTTNLIYVANSEGNSVSVIDGSTNAVTATVGGMSAPYFLGVNSTTNQVFVANSNGNNVTVIDGATNTIVTTVPVGRDPIGIRVKSISNLVYVANFVDGTISEIDGATDLVTNTFVLPPSRPEFIALDPMTNHLFVTDAMNEVVDVLDASSGALLNTITGGRVPFKALAYVVMFRPGKSILISDYSLNAVTEVNENTYAATAGLKGGIRPLGIAVNRKTGKIYVAEQGEDTVNVYNK